MPYTTYYIWLICRIQCTIYGSYTYRCIDTLVHVYVYIYIYVCCKIVLAPTADMWAPSGTFRHPLREKQLERNQSATIMMIIIINSNNAHNHNHNANDTNNDNNHNRQQYHDTTTTTNNNNSAESGLGGSSRGHAWPGAAEARSRAPLLK